MFPMNNRPPTPQRQMIDPFSIRPNRSTLPVPKSNSSFPLSVASFLNPSNGKLTKTLANVQQVMNMVESAAPMIKEYGPMVKNLPAMLKMMKALNETDEPETNTHTSKSGQRRRNNESNNETMRSERLSNNVSKPKLYI